MAERQRWMKPRDADRTGELDTATAVVVIVLSGLLGAVGGTLLMLALTGDLMPLVDALLDFPADPPDIPNSWKH